MVALLAVLSIAGWSGAQEPGQAEPDDETEEFFAEIVDVNVVNVDVYVTDKKGNPITGLSPEDFEVLEDGRGVAITNFYAVEGGRPTAASPQPATEPSGAVGDLPLLPPNQSLYLIVYIDNFNIRPLNRNRVFRRLREFLYDELEFGDQVMLVSYDRSIHVRHPFTTDPEIVARSLFDLEKLTGHAVVQDSERREILQAIDEAEEIRQVDWRVRQFAEAQYNDLRFTLDALQEFISSLGGLEGRKAILYMSDGLPMVTAQDLFEAMMRKFTADTSYFHSADFSAHRSFRELTSQANSNRVTFYTIDAAGLRTSSLTSAENRGISSPGVVSVADSAYISNMQGPLRMMAHDTGGRAILNTNDIGDGLKRMASDFGTYYSLGYMSSHGGDGRYHRIEVKVDRKGLRVRHRNGYRDKTLPARMADATTSTLLYGFERNPLSVSLEVGRGNQQQEKDRFMVPIVVELPLDKLELVARSDFHLGRIKIFFSALDEEGRMSDLQEVPLDIRIPSEKVEEALDQNYVYRVDLQMRGGPHRVALGVRDEIGSVESFISKSVVIGSG
jgi:VWFA-related protein